MPMSDGEVGRTMSESSIRRKKWQCNRIVDDRLDSTRSQVLCKRVALLVLNDVKVPYVLPAGRHQRQAKPVDA